MKFEVEIIKFLQSGRNGFFDFSFKALTLLGSIYAAGVFFLILLVFKRKYCLWFAGAYGVSFGVTYLIKHFVKRIRPFLVNDDIVCIGKVETGYCFPSGHSMAITCIAIFLVFVLLKYCKKNWQKVLTICGGVLLATLIVVSRMYLGVHYLTDTLAGVAIGAVFSAISIVVLHFYEKKKKKKEIGDEVKNGD